MSLTMLLLVELDVLVHLLMILLLLLLLLLRLLRVGDLFGCLLVAHLQ